MSNTVAQFVTVLPASASSGSEVAELLREARKRRGAQRQGLGRRIEHVMTTASSFALRNEAAIALLDLDQKDAGTSLECLLRRPEIAHSAGTLLYVMDELGLSISLDAVANIAEHGSYEARATMLGLVEDGRWVRNPQEERNSELLQRLKHIADSSDDDASEVAAIVLARAASAD